MGLSKVGGRIATRKRRAEPAQRFPPNGYPIRSELSMHANGGNTCGGSALRVYCTFRSRGTPGRFVGRNPRSGFRRMAARYVVNSPCMQTAETPAVVLPYGFIAPLNQQRRRATRRMPTPSMTSISSSSPQVLSVGIDTVPRAISRFTVAGNEVPLTLLAV
jgi:hypothetical protein